MARTDREARLAYGRAYYEKNKQLVLVARQAHYADNAERIRAERALKRDVETKAKNSEAQRARYRRLRAEVIEAYGSHCSCCGESQQLFLELDHIESDGASHRKEIGRGSYATYMWARRQNFPRSKFQLLCANCNQGRQRNGGVCPHHG